MLLPDQDRLKWREPWAMSRRRVLRDLAATGLLRPTSWIRIWITAGVIVAGLWLWAARAFPGVQLPSVWKVLSAFVLVPFMLVIRACLEAVNPVWVEITQSQVRMRGSIGIDLPSDRIRRLEVEDAHGSGPARLVVAYVTPRGRAREKRVAIAPAVDISKLREFVEALNGLVPQR